MITRLLNHSHLKEAQCEPSLPYSCSELNSCAGTVTHSSINQQANASGPGALEPCSPPPPHAGRCPPCAGPGRHLQRLPRPPPFPREKEFSSPGAPAMKPRELRLRRERRKKPSAAPTSPGQAGRERAQPRAPRPARTARRAPLSPARQGLSPQPHPHPPARLPSAPLTAPPSLPLHHPAACTALTTPGWETHTAGTIASHCPPSPYSHQPQEAPSTRPAAAAGELLHAQRAVA